MINNQYHCDHICLFWNTEHDIINCHLVVPGSEQSESELLNICRVLE